MKRPLYILLLCICIHQVHGQTEFQTKNLAAFCKVWGFLKYYHPYPSKKDVDWDKVLVDNYPKVKAAQTKQEFNNVILSITQMAGELKVNKHPFVPVDSCSKNADFKWMEDTAILSSQVCNYLQKIKMNHEAFKNKYARLKRYEGNFEIVEDADSEMVFPNEEYRFLALARYWNVINYYFPDKYLMDNDWNISLEKAIPIFNSASNQLEYYRAIEWISARTDDSHAGYVTGYAKADSIFRVILPFSFCFNHDSLVVTFLKNDSVCKAIGIEVGDIVTKINGKAVNEVWEDFNTHHSASNVAYAEYTFGAYPIYITEFKKEMDLEVLRNGKIKQVKAHFYKKGSIKMKVPDIIKKGMNPFEIDTDRMSGRRYGYIDMGLLNPASVDSVFKAANEVDYLVIDVRNYPRFAMYMMASDLMPERRAFAEFTIPDLDNPGYFIYSDKFMGGPSKKTNDYYKEKVIILIDHYTISHAEFTVMLLKLAPTATVIGAQTAGADGDVSTITLPGNYAVWFSGLGVYYPDGKQTQRIGIVPDIKVDYSIQSMLQKRDPIMERALEMIRTGK